jgi:hypothetical protein
MSLQTQFSSTLTNVGVKYMQDPAAFKAGKIFPLCPVTLLSSSFPTWDKSYWLKNEAQERTPGTISAGSPQGRGTDNYSCVDVSFHEDVPQEYIDNDPVALNPQKSAVRRVTHKIALYDEVQYVSNFFKTGVWGTDASAPSTKWDAANSTPLQDIDGYKRTMQSLTGRTPNKAVMSQKVFDVLKRHATIKGTLFTTTSGVPTAQINEQTLAAILELDEIIVLRAIVDSAKYGATASIAYIAGDKFQLLCTTMNPSLEEPSAGYNFGWSGFGTNGYGVRSWYREDPNAVRVEAHNYHQMKKVAADLGVFVDAPLT